MRTELQSFKSMLQRARVEFRHRHHPRWATADRIIFEAADTKLCFSFDHNGYFLDYSWGSWVDQDLGGDVEL